MRRPLRPPDHPLTPALLPLLPPHIFVLIPIARITHHFLFASYNANNPIPAPAPAITHNHQIPDHHASPPKITAAPKLIIPHTRRAAAPF